MEPNPSHTCERIVHLIVSYTHAGWKFVVGDDFYEFKSPNGRFVKHYAKDGRLLKLVKKTRSHRTGNKTYEES